MFIKNEIYHNGVRIHSLDGIDHIYLHIAGRNNKIYLEEFNGGGNISIGIGDNIESCMFRMGVNNRVTANLNISYYGGGNVFPHETFVNIGDGNIFNGDFSIISTAQKGTGVAIGNNNLFAGGISLHARVDHLVYDISTFEKFNQEYGITVGSNIWVGREVLMLNKAVISSNSIVGARALVNKKFESEHVLIAGNPAKVAKKNVMWNISLNDDYLTSENPIAPFWNPTRVPSWNRAEIRPFFLHLWGKIRVHLTRLLHGER